LNLLGHARPNSKGLFVEIPQQMVDEMIAHAQEDLPNECCGMIGGVDGVAKTLYKASNEFATPYSYKIDSDDQYRITEKEMRERSEDLLAIYHSHTRSAAYPSQTDLNEAANWPEPVYLIVSLEDRSTPVVKGFWLKDKRIADAEVVIS
jgi:[CysO sulfur-carrier protein]-S-L-cysteine hydrolase